ncbi:hypothetical protein H6P81_008366 [Aristolochia fimbriata]|uniref:Late embryogenesis abundant protein LEA-2 subgroup domain-containing protein n=1 Tax=Aristolochia fimbriata TaxID=158543 RepID=A0AAV7F6P9_ARIFI|nr:hypothetical protein H6P81_008366 [Aristolochia fimbriata]
MSQLPIRSSPKHCGIKQGGYLKGDNYNYSAYKKLFYFISSLVLSLLSLAFILWLIFRPSKPHFNLKESDIYQLNLSASPQGHLLNSTIQITVVSNNPNHRVGIYYDRIRAYASYKGQQITVEAALPTFYQGHGETNLLTALLSGDWVPVPPSFGDQLLLHGQMVILNIKLNGRLRWKVGSWVSGHYHFNVDCAAPMPLDLYAVPVSPPAASSLPTSTSSNYRGLPCSIDL